MLENKEAALSIIVPTRHKPEDAASVGMVFQPALPKVHAARLQDNSTAVTCLHAFLSEKDWEAGVEALVTQLNGVLKCHRVSLGWVSGHALRLKVLSDGVKLDEGVALEEVQQAMQEAADQKVAVAWPNQALPAQAKQGGVIHPEQRAVAHQTLCRVQGLSCAITVPLLNHAEVLGAITLERTEQQDPLLPISALQALAVGFTEEEQRWLKDLADLLAPALRLRYRLELAWYERGRGWLETLLWRLSDPRERVLRWSVLAFFGVLSFGVGLPLPFQTAARARLEGVVQRVMTAPQDGELREVNARLGDVVKAGQVLATLADDGLLDAQRAAQVRVSEHEAALASFAAIGDANEQVAARAALAESRAQLAVLAQQLSRLRIVAPFDGVVIAGQMNQQLGERVHRGDKLLTVAPGLDWRVVMLVDESDISALTLGQTAQVRLTVMPDQEIGLILSRVTPVVVETSTGPKYEVEAIANGAGAGARGLRPGLEGMARIDMPAKPLLWRAAGGAWRWLRTAAWTWL
jgi:biotin carboxyl carrier protein